MSKKWPKFKITVVIDGDSKGLLVEKQSLENSLMKKVYFYLSGGLAPNREIKDICSDNCFKLDANNYNEKRLFTELVEYAIAASNSGKTRMERNTVEKHHLEKGYRNTVDRYFEADKNTSPLREIFESAAVFKKCVLDFVRGRSEKVQGSAEYYTILPLESIGNYNFSYLQPIQDVLKVGEDIPAKWFRRQGPLATDFDDNRLYCREKLLIELKKLVLNNSFSILEGLTATGKTVLVRQLGYELYARNKMVVYYFDCDVERDFDLNELILEIYDNNSIFIIENIHLQTQKFQRFCAKLKTDNNKHILFTARPSFEENQNTKDFNLKTIKSIKLKPFDQIEKIISHFESYHSNVSWSADIRESIKTCTAKSFWLLSYALKGYIEAKGKGNPQSWLANGVMHDLKDLETLDPTFPEILIAVSPLYMNEVLTEESFLTETLRFNYKIIQKLVSRGDITEQSDKYGHVFYGLPHSALARMYWEHGRRYRIRKNLYDYNDFIYKYITSGVTNGLSALTSCSPDIKALITQLLNECKLAEVMENEQSMEAFSSSINDIRFNFEDPKWLTNDILEVVSRKITSTDDLYHAANCLHYIMFEDRTSFNKLWASFDLEILAHKLMSTDHFYGAYMFLLTIYSFESSIVKRLDLNDLSRRFNRSSDFSGICMFIVGVLHCDKEYAYKLWRMLDIERLASKIIADVDTSMAFRCLRVLFHYETKMGGQLWEVIDKEDLAIMLSERENVQFIGQDIGCLLDIQKEIAREFCAMLNLRKLGERLSNSQLLTLVQECINKIHYADPHISQKLCCSLDLRKLAYTLSKQKEDYVLSFLDTIDRSSITVGNKLRSLLNN